MTADQTICRYQGGVAIITGSASGIGKALAKELAKRGCSLVLADVQGSLVNRVALEINKSGGRALARQVNVTCFSTMTDLIRETIEKFGRLDYMFNNAGIGIDGTADQYDIDDWNQVIDVNLFGTINGIQAAYPIMAEQGFGQIVNTASIAGLVPIPGMVAYCTSKHAVVGLSKSLAPEAAQKGVGLNLLCPGYIQTPFLDQGGKFGRKLVSRSEEKRRQLLGMLEKFKPMPPDKFAAKALDQIAKNKSFIVIPSWYRLFLWAFRFFPLFTRFFVEKTFR